MRFGTWLLATLGFAIGLTGCSDSGKETTAPKDNLKAVAEALTAGVMFKDGIIKSGLIPAATADDVTVDENDPPLELAPGDTALMSLDVENPDEQDDPVVATLIQFDGSSKHVEVGVDGEGDGGTGADSGHVETEFELGDDICKTLCNEKFPVVMIQAIKLKGGKVSKHIERSFDLDCTDDGDEDLCQKDSGKPASGKPTAEKDASTPSEEPAAEPAAPDAASATLTSALAVFNRARCITCDGETDAYCDTAPFSRDAVTCVAKAVDDNADDKNVTGWANCVAAGLSGVNGKGGAAMICAQSCDTMVAACSSAAFDTAASNCNDLPGAVQADVDDCMLVSADSAPAAMP